MLLAMGRDTFQEVAEVNEKHIPQVRKQTHVCALQEKRERGNSNF